ncbi:MAG: MBL fold metallo-hydrolase [Cyanothece sp. SIO1E1]|nr:MBL fold metallo-hydrolase [Cyanothece sp. SIO1E1]
MSGSEFPVTKSPTNAEPVSRESAHRENGRFRPQFAVKFWGVRGSIPTPGVDTVRYGGNTACVEIQVGGKRLIFDGGTGLRVLGKHLLKQMPVEASIFFTHTHWDRIQGFPFFLPAFIAGNCFHIYGATAPNGASIKQRLAEQMLRPNFPTPLQMMQSTLKFCNVTPGSVVTLEDDITVETISLHRSNSALGYRITWQDHSVVYATDTDHSEADYDQNLLYLASEADLLIYDGTYVDHAYYDLDTIQMNGHAPWQRGVDIALKAGVKQLVMFYHDPTHDDDYLDHLEAKVCSSFSKTLLAREGMMLKIC